MVALTMEGLVGRDHELSSLERLLNGLTEGRGGLAWISGEPGIGKSALVSALLHGARRAGCGVYAAPADELAADFPLRPIADCLQVSPDSTVPGIATIANLLRGDHDSATGIDPIAAAAECVLEVIDRLSAQRPMLMVLEDLHWADRASLGVWSRLARSVNQIPLLLVGSCRPLPQRPELQRLSAVVDKLGALRLELAALSLPEIVDAARYLLGAQPGPRLMTELARTAGNPFYVKELVHAMQKEDLLLTVGDQTELVPEHDGIPQTLSDALTRQLSFLSPETYRVLRLAAMLAPEFGAAELALVSDRPIIHLTDVIRETIDGHVLVQTPGGLGFHHDLIRRALIEQTPATVRGEITRRLARTLAESGSPIDTVARQLLTLEALDDWALTWLAQTAPSAMRTAPEAYGSLLSHALGMLRDHDERWGTLASCLAQTQYWLGHDAAAGQTAAAVMRQTGDRELAGRMAVIAVRSTGRQARLAEALALADEFLADETMPTRWRARIRAWKAMVYVSRAGRRIDLANTIGHQAFTEAQSCEDPIGMAFALNVLINTDGHFARAHAPEVLRSLGDNAEGMELKFSLSTHRLMGLFEEGSNDEAEALVAATLPDTSRMAPSVGERIHYWAARMHYALGNWDEALHHLSMIDSEGPLRAEAADVAAQILVRRDQRDDAEARLRNAGLPDDPSDPSFVTSASGMIVSLSMLAQSRGEPDRALALSRELLAHKQTAGLPYGPDLVRLAIEHGDLDTARSLVAQAFATPAPRAEGAALGQAMLDDDIDGLRQLAEEYERITWRDYRAFALEELAVRLGRAGDVTGARAALTKATHLYGELGAALDIRRVVSRLRRHGVHRGPRSVHRRATHGWESLTPTEKRVAEFVAAGLSNPDVAGQLFVTRATVQTHVSSILGKLQMASRVELIRQRQQLTSQ